MFREGTIEGVVIKSLRRFNDHRGWLMEVYREDEMDETFHPVMAYISETLPGVARGPHEHVDQADTFGFVGPSNFKLYLWDNRPSSPTHGKKTVVVVGADNPSSVTIPAGVVHAYRNVGSIPGWVINCPNRLYAGKGKKEKVDEIRHEEAAGSPFALD
jgi:dTDP-4-dehydrorhamnose 3,5-epimerase